MDCLLYGGCEPYRIGYVAGLVGLFLSLFIVLMTRRFESFHFIEITNTDLKIADKQEYSSFFVFLGYALLLICLGAVWGVESFSFKAFLLLIVILLIVLSELYKPEEFVGQTYISFNKLMAYLGGIAISIWVWKGAVWF